MFETPDIQYVWAIWKKKKTGNWINITEKPPKYTKRASFIFGEKVIGEEFRLEIYKANKKMLTNEWEAKKMGEIFVIPTNSKTPKITKIALFNRGAKDINKASYRDTLIARAHCVAMFNQEVEFNLWEDDAAGGGHNAEINKNNKAPRTYKAKVNENGIAEAKISLSADERILRQIANKYMMKGDTDEGANHEYYVTASYSGKIQKASQVNVSVTNPDNRPKPKADTPKFPAGNTGNGAARQPDPAGNIHDAYFVNNQGQQLSKVSVGEHVKIRILSRNMIGKRIQYVVWEYDATSNDEVYRSGVMKIVADSCDTGGFVISENIFDKGIDLGSIDADAKKQNYFIEIISFDTSNTSKKFGITEEGLMTVEKAKSPAMVQSSPAPNTNNCGGKFCIKKGDKNELIREINIRLAGFGGNVPTDEFTDRTEKMIKQFQRDYMKVPETGKICGNVLRAIDEFQNKFSVDFNEIKCKCKNCTGFGDGSNKGKYLKGGEEAHHRYEYPGVHRSLLWALRAVKFYMVINGKYQFNKVNSGYRCRFHEEYKKKPTTNHMGKALDIHFNKNGVRTRLTADMEDIRLNIYNKYLGAKWDWKEKNIFNLESTKIGATTWVHYDVREFDTIYLDDKYFVKNVSELNGENIISMADRLGYKNTCLCYATFTSQKNEVKETTNKSKWSHSEFANLIAKEESRDNYNICNQTKGGLKIINNLKIVDFTIKEIQEKQKNRDVFAVGRYQLIPDTLNIAVNSLGLDTNKKFDEEMQDKIFDEYLIKVRRSKVISFLEGNGNVEDAMYSLAQEWASIGVEKGKRISDKVIKKDKKIVKRIVRYAEGGESYYAGDGLNKSHITPEQIKTALINSKDANK